MKFRTKQEQYEWWTTTIKKIQSHEESIRAGCREFGIKFWQYYEWKERVQEFVESGEVELSEEEKFHLPKGPQIQSLSFVELVEDVKKSSNENLVLHYKNSWSLEIPESFSSSNLSKILQSLASL